MSLHDALPILLAQITQQVAVVQYPSLRRSVLRHVELVPITDTRLTVVIITDTGRVEQRSLELPEALDPGVLGELRARLNAVGAGQQLHRLRAEFEALEEFFAPVERPAVALVSTTVLETIGEDVEDRIVMAGTANLARSDTDFPRTISPVLEALEEQVVLMRLLADMAEEAATTELAVRIGHETSSERLSETSVVAGGYGGTGADAIAQVGVLGPTRMEYPNTMAAVRAVGIGRARR